MTRRQRDKAHADLLTQYDQLRRILIAVVRERGTLRVTKADYDAAGRTWAIGVEPVERGAAVEVSASDMNGARILMPTPGRVVLQ